jgi:type III pantothenate kinase
MGALLTIDRGHSTLDCRIAGDGASRRERLDATLPEAQLAAAFGRFLGESRPARAAGLTVVPGGLEPVAALLARAGVALQIAGRELRCPLRIDYDDPATLGADRWVGAYAAWRRVGAAVVVDCGTALTVNLVDAGGAFVGGAIAPGLPPLQQAVRASTPRLPAIDPSWSPAPLPPRSTRDAVQIGLLHGFCGIVERLVADLTAAAGLREAPVLLTGGSAGVYERYGRLPFVPAPELIHDGLAWLLHGPDGGC